VTTLLVAANGGHLAQLVELVPRLGPLAADRLWLTPPGAQANSLLAGERRVDAPPVREREVVNIGRTARIAHRLLHEQRIGAVVSTGSGIALGVLPYAAARGVPTHYIESATFVGRRSMTARVLERVPRVRLHTQYPHMATGRWHYAGSVFEGYVPVDAPPVAAAPPGRPPRPLRIVVTLGSDRWPFRRVVERLVAILPADASVLWQVGPTPIDDLGLDAVAYLPADRLAAELAAADVVIAHAGCGSALTALAAGRVPLLVPRDPRHGEVVDDHQVAFARHLEALGLAVHRPVEELTAADVAAMAGRGAARAASPPPLELDRSVALTR
jgi:UDP-N-acetylglucosamine transferase subunit ALG13